MAKTDFHKMADFLKGQDAGKLLPGLYIVATPIGNLGDITLRALDVLARADRVLAEDTRRTGQLLAAFGIEARQTSYHDHNAGARIPQILEMLEAGEAIALVSDAGTPLISDPGFKLVRAVREAGMEVFPIPGASAAIAALSVAGLPSDQFTFAGFLPTKSGARKTVLRRLSDAVGTLIFYETGPRLKATLTDMHELWGERDAVIARELTKTYEEVRRGTLSELIPDAPPKGEIVILVAPKAEEVWTEEAVDAALAERSELSAKAASQQVAVLSGWSKREVYNRLQATR